MDRSISPDIEAAEAPPSSSYPNAGASYAASASSTFGQMAGENVQDRRFTGGDTLNEPVTTTLMRDIRASGKRVLQVIWPRSATWDIRVMYNDLQHQFRDADGFAQSQNQDENQNNNQQQQQLLHDWDLWGPLVFCLLLSLILSLTAPGKQSSIVFSGVFALFWAGLGVSTLNIKLLGGSISYFHALSILGYSTFPILIASVFSSFLHSFLIRLPIDFLLLVWALYAAIYSLRIAGIIQSRVFLAIYPVFLFYFSFIYLCFIT